MNNGKAVSSLLYIDLIDLMSSYLGHLPSESDYCKDLSKKKKKKWKYELYELI